MLARYEVLRLQFFTAAGCVLQAEVRQAFMPGAWNAQLGGAILRGHPGDRMERPGGKRGPKQLPLRRPGSVVRSTTFEPDLIEPSAAPIGEEADAVGA